ncbi:hypothetical protein IQ277_11695 [Nostocales cyanobacterium LEGE 12452]|nr:hypothetical protein [Nostocales cyanobacterium LEGE 12452]
MALLRYFGLSRATHLNTGKMAIAGLAYTKGVAVGIKARVQIYNSFLDKL